MTSDVFRSALLLGVLSLSAPMPLPAEPSDAPTGEPSVRAILEQLKSSDRQRRQAAEAELKRLGASALPGLAEAARDNDPRLRGIALNQLGNLKYPETLSLFAAALDDSSSAVRTMAAVQLHRFGVKALPLLVWGYRDPDPLVRVKIITSAGQIQHMQSLSLLIQALNDSDVPVREYAAKGMGSFQTPLALTALTRALFDPHVWIQDGARQSLRKMGPAAIAPMTALLGESDTPKGVRQSAAQVLMELGHPDTIPELSRRVTDPQVEVRGLSIVGLGRHLVHAPSVLASLAVGLDDHDPRIRLSVVDALRGTSREEARRLLERASQDKDPSVAEAARHALKP